MLRTLIPDGKDESSQQRSQDRYSNLLSQSSRKPCWSLDEVEAAIVRYEPSYIDPMIADSVSQSCLLDTIH
jgi:hypothetical protein